MSYFLPYSYSKRKVEIELDLSNYTTKSDLKIPTGVDTSQFAKKDNLTNLNSELDKLDIDKLSELDGDKLKLVPVDLSKLGDVVKNDVVKKDVYNAKIKDIKDKIPDITNLGTTVTPNAKINEVKNEIPSITDLATTTALTAVGNKIPNVSDLVKKADYHAEIKDIETNISPHLILISSRIMYLMQR